VQSTPDPPLGISGFLGGNPQWSAMPMSEKLLHMRTLAIETASRAIEIVTTPIALAGVFLVLIVVFSGVAGRAVLLLESRTTRISDSSVIYSQTR